ncbi:sugar phosphate nucleotidyltransferase [Parapedobacter tibetensis]|uniref:sugar phosphate nucleotidyltransferase n=1 Tax=Parapedobacter tibetensis TaxID=2972951 RepID=UPI00214DA8B2|nr:sugar phosphate nucleotidyltransferase [Parapedobacter tibetensis]
MEYAIIAAGEGSRLKMDGVDHPKPMVTLQGVKLIDLLIRQFIEASASAIHIIINEQSPELDKHLALAKFPVPVDVIRKTTPSSLHSFHELLLQHPTLHECCLATTDTVFLAGEFKRFIEAFQTNPAIDAMMAVTTYIDDESPLYVSVDAENTIHAFSGIPIGNPEYVSGGIYCLRRNAIDSVHSALNKGMSRMRNFQQHLIDQGLAVAAFPFSKIIDIDHLKDIKTAESFLMEHQHKALFETTHGK